MATLHVLDATTQRMRVAIHIPVPAGNNPVGVAWRTALVRSGIGGKTVLPEGDGTGGTISVAEKADIVSGASYEALLEEKLRPMSNAELDDLFNTRRAQVLSEIQSRLRFYGATR